MREISVFDAHPIIYVPCASSQTKESNNKRKQTRGASAQAADRHRYRPSTDRHRRVRRINKTTTNKNSRAAPSECKLAIKERQSRPLANKAGVCIRLRVGNLVRPAKRNKSGKSKSVPASSKRRTNARFRVSGNFQAACSARELAPFTHARGLLQSLRKQGVNLFPLPLFAAKTTGTRNAFDCVIVWRQLPRRGLISGEKTTTTKKEKKTEREREMMGKYAQDSEKWPERSSRANNGVKRAVAPCGARLPDRRARNSAFKGRRC